MHVPFCSRLASSSCLHAEAIMMLHFITSSPGQLLDCWGLVLKSCKRLVSDSVHLCRKFRQVQQMWMQKMEAVSRSVVTYYLSLTLFFMCSPYPERTRVSIYGPLNPWTSISRGMKSCVCNQSFLVSSCIDVDFALSGKSQFNTLLCLTPVYFVLSDGSCLGLLTSRLDLWLGTWCWKEEMLHFSDQHGISVLLFPWLCFPAGFHVLFLYHVLQSCELHDGINKWGTRASSFFCVVLLLFYPALKGCLLERGLLLFRSHMSE